jgi:RNA polymerase sigma-70 factor (ECF subfamily)
VLGNWAEAQDVAQETFIRAYSNLDQLREPAKFAAWLRRVAFGVSMDWLRAFRPKMFEQLDGRVDLDHLEIPDFQPTPAEAAEKRELAEAVLAAVASLPQKYRVPLTMFHLDGLSYKKVADFLDIPLGTAKSLISRAQAKIKAILETTAKEMIPMVQEVFDEHKLPQEFARKVIESVPVLAWGTGKECTFVGALEAAMSVTPHPAKYTDLMGWSRLAFRVRWWRWTDQPRWCHSSAVGEFPEEDAAIQKATGWRFDTAWHNRPEQRAADIPTIVAAIDAGLPVVGYDDGWNVSVAHGYEEGGKKILWRNYSKGPEPHAIPAEKIGPWLEFFRSQDEPLSPRDALVESLGIAVRNWRRGHSDAGIKGRDYWYGTAAFDAWIKDLGMAGTLDAETRNGLLGISTWSFVTLLDSRSAAATFLADHAGHAAAAARGALDAARLEYERETATLGQARSDKCAFVAAHPGPDGGWTKEMMAREQQILAEARQHEEAAIAQIEKALAAMSSE